MPPVIPVPEGSNPQGEEKAIGKEHVAMGDVVGMIGLFTGCLRH